MVLTHDAEALPPWLRAHPELALSFAATLVEARALLRSHKPEAVVVDRAFHPQDRGELLRVLRAAGPHVLFLGAGGETRAAPPPGVLERLGVRTPVAAPLTRVPIKRGDEIVLLPVREVASLEAEGELVHLTTVRGERHTVSRPLKALEARLDAEVFMRLSRSVLVNVNAILRLRVLRGGGLCAVLVNQAEFPVSRSQSAPIRRRLLDL